MKNLKLFACAALALVMVVAACGGQARPNPAQTTARSEPTPTAGAGQPAPTPVSQAAPTTQATPQACTLLTVADLEKVTGYPGGQANVLAGMEAGDSNCDLVNAQDKLKVSVGVNHIPVVVPPGAKTLDLEGGAQAVIGDSGWITNIRFPGYSVVLLLMGGTAANGDAAQVTKADGTIATYAQVYEALARAIAHNAAAGGVPAPAGVIDLNAQGDPCRLLTSDDIQSTLPGFAVTRPETRDGAYGGKQCVYQFTNDTLKAAGWVALEFITQDKFDLNMQNGQVLTGIGDAAAVSPSGGLQVKKGSTLIYLTMNIDSNDPSSLEQVGQIRSSAFTRLAQKAAGRIGQ